MKAIVYRKYGSPELLKMEEVEKPVPGPNQVLIQVKAASVNSYDWRHLRADPFLIRFMVGGVFKPKQRILGADIAGIVVSTGENAKVFKPGDEVFGEAGYGGYAEFVCVDEKRIVSKSGDISFDIAAASPMAGLTALQGLRDVGNISEGQKVLVHGASGGVGSFAVQIACSFGAVVTGVCSTEKIDTVYSFGAEKVLDYKKDDIFSIDYKFDLIFDTASYYPLSSYKKILKPGGKYIQAGGSMKNIFKLMIKSKLGQKWMYSFVAKISQEDLATIGKMLLEGSLKPFIDKRFPLNQTSEAFKYYESGKVKGKIIITNQ